MIEPTTGKDEYTPVNHPLHYNVHPNGIECIDVVEGFNFNVGNAIKYLWRAGLKSDDTVKDLEKAAWYVQRELERAKPATVLAPTVLSIPMAQENGQNHPHALCRAHDAHSWHVWEGKYCIGRAYDIT